MQAPNGAWGAPPPNYIQRPGSIWGFSAWAFPGLAGSGGEVPPPPDPGFIQLGRWDPFYGQEREAGYVDPILNTGDYFNNNPNSFGARGPLYNQPGRWPHQ